MSRLRAQGSGVVNLPAAGLILLILVIYPLLFTSQFWGNVGILSLVFAMAAMGWNILGGYTGQISFGNAMFFGAGAYTTALLVKHGWSPWITMLIGAAIASAVGLVIGIPCFRLRSHYFAIATLAIGEIVDSLVNANSALGASSGVTIPTRANSLANLQFNLTDLSAYYYVALVLMFVVAFVAWLFAHGRVGLYARAIRDDEQAASAAGVPAWRYKLLAVAVAAAVTALAGSMYAMYGLFIDPLQVLDLSISVNIVLMVILGGSGTFFGPILGAWVLTILQQYTAVHFGSRISGLDLLIFGVLIVLIVLAEPGGLEALARRVFAAGLRLTQPITTGRGGGRP